MAVAKKIKTAGTFGSSSPSSAIDTAIVNNQINRDTVINNNAVGTLPTKNFTNAVTQRNTINKQTPTNNQGVATANSNLTATPTGLVGFGSYKAPVYPKSISSNMGVGSTPSSQYTNYLSNLGTSQTQANQQASDYMKSGLDNLKTQADLGSKQIFEDYAQTIGSNEFQQAIQKSQYSNADQVTKNLNLVQQQFVNGIQDPLIISQNTKLPIETVNKILQGKGMDDLQMSDWYKAEIDKPYQQAQKEIELNQQRTQEDLKIGIDRIKQTSARQTDDLKNTLAENSRLAIAQGAMSGDIMSSGYMQGIKNLEDKTNNVIGRLQTTTAQSIGDVTLKGQRIMEDLETNLTKIHDAYTVDMTKLKTSRLGTLQDLQAKHSISDRDLTKQLSDLQTMIAKGEADIINNTLDLRNGLMDTKMKELELLQKLQDVNTADSKWLEVGGKIIYKDAQGNFQTYNPSGVKAVDQTTVMEGVQNWYDTYKDGTPGTRTGQCGAFVNDYLKYIGSANANLFADPISQKASLKNSDQPTVGSIAIMDIPGSENGHVGIVVGFDKNGNVLLKDSNRSSDKKVQTHAVDPKKIYGYFDPTLAGGGTSEGTTLGGKNYNPDYSNDFLMYMESGTRPLKSTIEALGGDTEFRKQAIAYYSDIKPQQLKAQGIDTTNFNLYLNTTKEIKKDIDDSVQSANDIRVKLKAYYDKIKENGGSIGTISGYGRELTQMYNDILGTIKEKAGYNLGVLNGQDLEFLMKAVPNVVGPKDVLYVDSAIKGLENLDNQLVSKFNARSSGYGVKYNPTNKLGGNTTTSSTTTSGNTTTNTNTSFTGRPTRFTSGK